MKQSVIQFACQEKTADHVSAKKGISSSKSFSEAKLSIEQNVYRINKFLTPSRDEFLIHLINNMFY